MIIVAFLLPLAVYLLALSWVNRQPQPVFVSGTWDFIGLLFAASGFLLVGGPAALSSVYERWRMLWLLGDGGSLTDQLELYRESWLLLAAAYFVVVVAGGAWALARRRGTTCIYNVEPAEVEAALEGACRQLSLAPIRTANLYVFGYALGPKLDLLPQPGEPGQAQAPSATLEVESFRALKHVSLHWQPHDSPLRLALETDLRRRLADSAAPQHDAAVWFNLAGTGILVVSLVIVAGLVLRGILMR